MQKSSYASLLRPRLLMSCVFVTLVVTNFEWNYNISKALLALVVTTLDKLSKAFCSLGPFSKALLAFLGRRDVSSTGNILSLCVGHL
jgi:hypothetical protein